MNSAILFIPHAYNAMVRCQKSARAPYLTDAMVLEFEFFAIHSALAFPPQSCSFLGFLSCLTGKWQYFPSYLVRGQVPFRIHSTI